jgi:hypothetical protein
MMVQAICFADPAKQYWTVRFGMATVLAKHALFGATEVLMRGGAATCG